MRAELNPVPPVGYVAMIGERCRVVSPPRNLYPDVFVREESMDYNSSSMKPLTAVIDRPDPSIIVEFSSEEERIATLEIRSLNGDERVVTVIELLSPVDKAAGEGDRERYLRKQKELLQSRTHLLEIDLLRGGCPTVAAYSESLNPELNGDYIVCLHRAGQFSCFETLPIKLENRLPRVSVTLDENLPDAMVDLQAVFDRNYEVGAYGLQIDYIRDVFPALSAPQTLWADTLLREKGLR